MIDLNRKNLRAKLIQEGLESAHKRNAALLEATLREAREQYLLEVAEYIQANKEYIDKNFPAALQHLENAIKLEPHFVDAHILKGNVYIEMKDYESAIRSIDYSIQNLLLMNHAVFYNNKGVVFARLGRLDEAIFCHLRAIEDDENYELAYTNCLILVSKKNAWLDLIALSRRIREKFRDKPNVLDMTAVVLLNQAETALKAGDPSIFKELVEESGKQLEIAVALAPSDSGILYNLACFYSRSDRRPEAIETLKKVFEGTTADEKKKFQLLARSDLDFANIREEPFFKKLVQDLE
jgi:tetratricopeptide (TPR) repeat protein